MTSETDFHPYEQDKSSIDPKKCIAKNFGKFSAHDETSRMNRHYQAINFGDVDDDDLSEHHGNKRFNKLVSILNAVGFEGSEIY